MSAENRCRTCGHCWEMHDHHGRKRCYEFFDEDYTPINECNCDTGWMSGDNLEFLEQEYAKRRLDDGRGKV